MTEEEEVSYFLKDWYASRPSIIVHSWHPPCGKTYEGALVRIPKLVHGVRTRQRYHIDFILQIGSVLVLQELKGSSSETTGDVAKLREIVGSYSPEQVAAVLRPRVTNRAALREVTTLIPSIAHAAPAPQAIEPEFLRVVTNGTNCTAYLGSSVETSTRSTIADAFG